MRVILKEVLEVARHVMHVSLHVLRRFEWGMDVEEPSFGLPRAQRDARPTRFRPSLGLRQLGWIAVGLKDDTFSRRPRLHEHCVITLSVDMDGFHRVQPLGPRGLPGSWGVHHHKGAPKGLGKPSSHTPSPQPQCAQRNPLGPCCAMSRLNGLPCLVGAHAFKWCSCGVQGPFMVGAT